MKNKELFSVALMFFLAMAGCFGGAHVSPAGPSRKTMVVSPEKPVENVTPLEAKTFVCCSRDEIDSYRDSVGSKAFEGVLKDSNRVYVCPKNLTKASDDRAKHVTVTCEKAVEGVSDVEARAFICCTREEIDSYKDTVGEKSFRQVLDTPSFIYVCPKNLIKSSD